MLTYIVILEIICTWTHRAAKKHELCTSFLQKHLFFTLFFLHYFKFLQGIKQGCGIFYESLPHFPKPLGKKEKKGKYNHSHS